MDKDTKITYSGGSKEKHHRNCVLSCHSCNRKIFYIHRS